MLSSSEKVEFEYSLCFYFVNLLYSLVSISIFPLSHEFLGFLESRFAAFFTLRKASFHGMFDLAIWEVLLSKNGFETGVF